MIIHKNMPSAKDKWHIYKNKCLYLIKGITCLTYRELLNNNGKALLQKAKQTKGVDKGYVEKKSKRSLKHG